jgi:hypothetical protein
MPEYGQYVYFIIDGHNHVKIGVSSGKIEGRLSQLQTGNPFKLKMYERIFLNYTFFLDAFDVEKAFHEKFKDYRLEGEWFLFEPVKEYLDWLAEMCIETKKKDLQKITNLTTKHPDGTHKDFFIFGKYRTSTTKETILCAELLKGGEVILGN